MAMLLILGLDISILILWRRQVELINKAISLIKDIETEVDAKLAVDGGKVDPSMFQPVVDALEALKTKYSA